jgi:hypothetical protein
MGKLDSILQELDELYIVNTITREHDETRMTYRLPRITVDSDAEFDDVIAEYYNYHFTRCISYGGSLPRSEAAGRAKEIIEKAYRRKGMDRLAAYSDGKNGTNGGMRAILDLILESLKDDAVERHIREVIDRYVAPSSFDEQVDIVREIIARMGYKPAYIDARRPERYARNYEELIRALVESVRTQSSRFRRL